MGDHSLGAHAAILRDLLDRLEIERVWLFWSDVGGRVLMRPVPRTGRAAWL
jgi:pimeloyl-ACP methyl ester carboxylesterase